MPHLCGFARAQLLNLNDNLNLNVNENDRRRTIDDNGAMTYAKLLSDIQDIEKQLAIFVSFIRKK